MFLFPPDINFEQVYICRATGSLGQLATGNKINWKVRLEKYGAIEKKWITRKSGELSIFSAPKKIDLVVDEI